MHFRPMVSQDWIGLDKGGHLVLQVSDWGAVFFRFDCGDAKFKFDGVQLGGI